MKPGRELDALVAEKVMGLEVMQSDYGPYLGVKDIRYGEPGGGAFIRHYSTDIVYAWQVFDKFPLNNLTKGAEGWVCRFGVSGPNKYGGFTISQYDAKAETASHAICLAALRAVGEKV